MATLKIGSDIVLSEDTFQLDGSGNMVVAGNFTATGEIATLGNIRNSTFAGENEIESDNLDIGLNAVIGANINIGGDGTCGGLLRVSNYVSTPEIKGLKQVVLNSDSGGAPAVGMTTQYVKNGHYIIAFNKAGLVHYRWFNLEDSDNPVVWHYDTTEPS